MRGLWWTLKLLAGLVLIGCLLAFTLQLVFPVWAQYLWTWLGTLLGSAGVYLVANIKLGPPVRRPPVANWQGQLFVLPAPLVRQGGLCLVIAGLSIGVPLAFVRDGHLPSWQAGLVLLGSLLGLWLLRAACIGFLNMKRAGYALKLDAAGVHYPGLPLLPWTEITGLTLEPPRSDSDRAQSLALRMEHMPEQPTGLHALWRAALPGASFARGAVNLPLPTMRKPTAVLDAAQTLWHRHAQQSGRKAPHTGKSQTPND